MASKAVEAQKAEITIRRYFYSKVKMKISTTTATYISLAVLLGNHSFALETVLRGLSSNNFVDSPDNGIASVDANIRKSSEEELDGRSLKKEKKDKKQKSQKLKKKKKNKKKNKSGSKYAT